MRKTIPLLLVLWAGAGCMPPATSPTTTPATQAQPVAQVNTPTTAAPTRPEPKPERIDLDNLIADWAGSNVRVLKRHPETQLLQFVGVVGYPGGRCYSVQAAYDGGPQRYCILTGAEKELAEFKPIGGNNPKVMIVATLIDHEGDAPQFKVISIKAYK